MFANFERLKKKVREFRDMVTMEPCIAIYLIGLYVTGIANQNLLLDKTCRVNLEYGDELCDALIKRDFVNSTTKSIDLEVQKFVTYMNSIGKLMQIVIPMLMVLFWGTWSDRHRLRKPLIIVPLLGECLKNICLLFCVTFEKSDAQTAFFVENIFPLVFGNWVVVVMGVFSHIMDTTPPQKRTVKIAFNNIFITLGEPIGSSLSGILLKKVGYFGIFSLSAILMFVGILFCAFGVKEAPREVIQPVAALTEGKQIEKEKEIDNDREVKSVEQSVELKRSRNYLICDFFNMKDIRTILTVLTRKREENKRKMLYLCYTLLFFAYGPAFGSGSVSYLFTRHQFNFTEIEYSIYGTIGSISYISGIAVIMCLNTRFFHMNNYSLILLGLMGCIGASITNGLAKVVEVFYMGIAIDTVAGVLGVALRAALMQQVDSEEAARANAIIGALEGSMYQLFGMFYNFVYNHTMDSYAGAFYFCSTGCYVIALVVGVVLRNIHKRTEKEQETIERPIEEGNSVQHENSLDKY